MYKKKFKMSLLIFLVFSMILVSPQLTKAVNPTIKIGALGPLAITPGVDMQRGAELAVSEINTGGGFTIAAGTFDFELILETTSGSDGLPDAQVAATSISKLIVTDSVVAMLGGFRTEVVLGAVQPAINTSLVPFLGVGSTAPIITEYFYRVGPVNGTTLVRNLIAFYLFEMAAKGATEVVVVREDAAWTAAVAGGVKPTLQVGETLGSANFTFGTDVLISEGATGPEIATALGTIPSTTKAIMTLFSAPVGKAVTEQWAATGMSADTYLAGINVEGQKNTHFIDTGGAAAGEILLENAPPGQYPTAKTKAFIDAYFVEYGVTPTYTSYAAYDSVYIIREAIVNGDSSARADIHAELPNTDWVGTSGQIAFTSEPSSAQTNSPSLGGAYDAFNNTIAHDLFTPSTVGVSGAPYVQVYFSQWTSTGFREAVWRGGNISPISGPPFVPNTIAPTTITNTDTSTVAGTDTTITESGSDTTVIGAGSTETVTGAGVTVTDTEDAPGFYMAIVLFSTIFIATYISRARRRKGF